MELKIILYKKESQSNFFSFDNDIANKEGIELLNIHIIDIYISNIANYPFLLAITLLCYYRMFLERQAFLFIPYMDEKL